IVGTGESSDHATHGSGYRKTLGAALFVDSRKPAAILSWRAAACRGGQGEGVLTRDVPDAHALWPVKLRRETGRKIRFTREEVGAQCDGIDCSCRCGCAPFRQAFPPTASRSKIIVSIKTQECWFLISSSAVHRRSARTS